jgi:hypothetical protein
MKTPSFRRPSLLILSAIAFTTFAPHPANAVDGTPAPAAAKTQDDVLESSPFVVTEKSRGLVPFNGSFRYSRLTGKVRTPVIISACIRYDQDLSLYGVKPGDRIHAINGQKIVGLKREELRHLWLDAADSGEPVTLSVASATDKSKSPALRDLTLKRVAPVRASADDAKNLKDAADLIQKTRDKQHHDETDFTAELAAFDALIAHYEGKKTPQVAQIIIAKATSLALAMWDFEAADQLLAQLIRDFPNTSFSSEAEKMRAVIERMPTKLATPSLRKIVGQPAPPLDFLWCSRPDVKSLADFNGKVVVLCFWATTSPQSVKAFDHLKFVADHYAGFPVEMLNVTSIQGRVVGLESKPIDTAGKPDKEISLLKKYVTAKKITWPVALSRQPAVNADYGLTEIPSVTIIAPDGTVRENGLNPNMPLRIRIEPLLREFNLPSPTPESPTETE